MPSGPWAPLTCPGVLPPSQLSGLTSTPPTGRAGTLPQAGADKCFPEMSAPLICVGQSGPGPTPHVAATQLNGETQRAGHWH